MSFILVAVVTGRNATYAPIVDYEIETVRVIKLGLIVVAFTDSIIYI